MVYDVPDFLVPEKQAYKQEPHQDLQSERIKRYTIYSK